MMHFNGRFILSMEVALCSLIVTFLSQIHHVTSQTSVNDKTVTEDTCYCLHEITNGLHNPVAVIFLEEDTKERALIVEQRGIVFRYDMDGTKVDTFMDIRDRVVTSGDFGEARGLLSLVLDPFFDVTKKVYAYYIRKDQGNEYAYVSTFRADDGKVDPSTEKFLLRIYQPYKHGNGGPMLFGDDGYLYIMTGDGGVEDDPQGNAQNKNSFHGSVLRIDVDGTQDFTEGESGTAKMYSVPSTNPFLNMSDARPEVFAYGIRNMWGCTLDSAKRKGGTGRIFCAETGTNKFDEIDIIENGRNYGWNIKEGTACRNGTTCDLENEGLPIHEFSHNSSTALVGGYVYRGKDFTWMMDKGYYTFGDVITGRTYFLAETSSPVWEDHSWPTCVLTKCPSSAKGKGLNHILAFGQDIEGELYMLMTDEHIPTKNVGKMFKMVPPNRSSLARPESLLVILCALLLFIRQSTNL